MKDSSINQNFDKNQGKILYSVKEIGQYKTVFAIVFYKGKDIASGRVTVQGNTKNSIIAFNNIKKDYNEFTLQYSMNE